MMNGVIAELYNVSNNTGYFRNVGYVQDPLNNQATTFNNRVYGYTPYQVRPDNFLYYNIDKILTLGLEDPAELWLKGEWTWDKFDAWVKNAQMYLETGENVIDCGYAEFSIGATAGLGYELINSEGKVLFATTKVANVFEKMQYYYNNGYWDKTHGIQDVSANFKLGKSLLHTGSLWFLNNPKRFTPSGTEGGVNFNIGVVPYPTANNQEVTIYTESYEYIDTDGKIIKH